MLFSELGRYFPIDREASPQHSLIVIEGLRCGNLLLRSEDYTLE